MTHSTLCVGADVHLDQIVLCAVDKAEGHEVCERFHVTNNLPGAQAAATTIAAIAASLGCTRIEIGWEATGMLWIPFHRYLSDCSQLQPFERELVCFNPQLVSKFKQLGFTFVTLDLEGLRSGSLNALVQITSHASRLTLES